MVEIIQVSLFAIKNLRIRGFFSANFIIDEFSNLTEISYNLKFQVQHIIKKLKRQKSVRTRLINSTYEECVQSLLGLGMETGGEGFTNLNRSEISELVQKDLEPFSAEDIDHLLTEESEILEKQTKIIPNISSIYFGFHDSQCLKFVCGKNSP